jgi:hypothetical protein
MIAARAQRLLRPHHGRRHPQGQGLHGHRQPRVQGQAASASCPSQTLLDSDLGKLILQNFDEVSANSFQYLIEGSAALRARVEASRRPGALLGLRLPRHRDPASAAAYQWQTYTSYTQGNAKMRLEAHRPGRLGPGHQGHRV